MIEDGSTHDKTPTRIPNNKRAHPEQQTRASRTTNARIPNDKRAHPEQQTRVSRTTNATNAELENTTHSLSALPPSAGSAPSR
eukprot:1397267-Rhodomonas_salina.1